MEDCNPIFQVLWDVVKQMVGFLSTHHFCGQFIKVNKSLKVSSNERACFVLWDVYNVNTLDKKSQWFLGILYNPLVFWHYFILKC